MSALLESLKQKKPSSKFETINIKITKDTDAKIKIINKKHLDSSINLQAFRKKIINRKTQSLHDISVFKEDKLKIPVQLKKKPMKKTRDEIEKDVIDEDVIVDDEVKLFGPE